MSQREFKYVAVVTGKIPAKNRSNAYLQVSMGLSMNIRLQQSQHDVAIEIIEFKEPGADPEIEALAEDEQRVPPFDLPVAPGEAEEDG